MAHAASEEETVTVVVEALISISNLLESYDVELDQNGPWKELKTYFEELYRYKNEYSKEGAGSIDEVRAQLKDGNNEYSTLTHLIREWCDVIKDLLRIFKGRAHATDNAQVLIAMLGEAINRFKTVQCSLIKTSRHFCSLKAKMFFLLDDLDTDFDENSDFMEKQVKKLENTTSDNVASAFGLISPLYRNKRTRRKDIIAQLKQRLESVKQFHANGRAKIDLANSVIKNVSSLTDESIPAIEVQKTLIERFGRNLHFNTKNLSKIRGEINHITYRCEKYLQAHQNQTLLMN